MSNLDLARALKDKDYFNRLDEAEKARVRALNQAGEAALDDDELETVSGGLAGGGATEATTTTTNGTCPGPCSCICDCFDGPAGPA